MYVSVKKATRISCTKMAEPIELQFGEVDSDGPRLPCIRCNHNLYSPVWKYTGSNENKQKNSSYCILIL